MNTSDIKQLDSKDLIDHVLDIQEQLAIAQLEITKRARDGDPAFPASLPYVKKSKLLPNQRDSPVAHIDWTFLRRGKRRGGQIMYQTTFTVAGKGPFPIDMLQYDRCYPADSADITAMMKHGYRKVKLITYTPYKKDINVTELKWNYAGWVVVPAKRKYKPRKKDQPQKTVQSVPVAVDIVVDVPHR